MLSPHDRENLTAALAPPSGFVLDAAVGTAFSLDLEALLSVPIAVALFGAEAAETTDDGAEPVGLLEAIRRHTDQITLYCQAGQIVLPRRARTVFAWLEDAVVEVQAPRPARLFHPKLWAIRYARPDSDDRLLRVLVPTRNLTFDTSWDTLLALDSEVWSTTASAPAEGDEALADLVGRLPGLATAPVDARRRRMADSLAEDCRRHALTPPAPFSELRFHTLGFGPTAPPPFPSEARGVVVVSPFLGDDLLRDIADRYPIRALISREDALDRTDRTLLEGIDRVAVLNDVVAMDGMQEDEGPQLPVGAVHTDEDRDPGTRLSGLHAKLYVFDTPHRATWLTGSANATRAAFDGNVEVLAELKGPRHQVGTKALLADTPTEVGFDDLLMDHRPIDASTEPTAHERLQQHVDGLRRQMAALAIHGTVTPADADLSLTLMTDQALPTPKDGQTLRITVWPVTLQEQTSRRTALPGEPLDVTFGVTLEGLSAFIGVRLDLEEEGEAVTTGFVTRATLTGVPDDRMGKLLAAMLRDPQRLLRYLLMLLQSDDMVSREMGGDHDGWLGRLAAGGSWDDLPVLERLVQSVDRHPDRLDHFHRVLTDLGDERDAILPLQFMAVWLPVWQARTGGRP